MIILQFTKFNVKMSIEFCLFFIFFRVEMEVEVSRIWSFIIKLYFNWLYLSSSKYVINVGEKQWCFCVVIKIRAATIMMKDKWLHSHRLPSLSHNSFLFFFQVIIHQFFLLLKVKQDQQTMPTTILLLTWKVGFIFLLFISVIYVNLTKINVCLSFMTVIMCQYEEIE